MKRALQLSNDNCLIILCRTSDFSKIHERLQLKKYDYKNPFDIDINEHIYFIENEIKKDISENFWNSEQFQFIEVNMDTLNDLESNIHLITKILNELEIKKRKF